MTNAALEPVAVWDCREPEWFHDWAPKSAWLAGQGLPRNVMYRVEFFLAEMPCARIYCYALNAEGRRHLVHAPGDCRPESHGDHCVAREEPRMVPLSELPPAELW